MLLINSDLMVRVFSGSEFMLSEGSKEHATDRNFKPSNHTGVRADWQPSASAHDFSACVTSRQTRGKIRLQQIHI